MPKCKDTCGSGISALQKSKVIKVTDLETKLSMDIDTNILRPVYHQFANMMAYWANQRTKKFKFKFIFEGFETTLSRDERFERAKDLAESGIVIDQKFASALGMTPFDFRRMIAETRANKFVERLTPIVKASQMPADAKGRPAKKDSKLGDAGAETREAGSNDENAEE